MLYISILGNFDVVKLVDLLTVSVLSLIEISVSTCITILRCVFSSGYQLLKAIVKILNFSGM